MPRCPSVLIVFAACAVASAQPQANFDWHELESPLLSGAVQLTSRDRFVKAGEAYFSPDSRWIIFQAVPVPPEGAAPDDFYSMYVAKLTRAGDGRVTGTEEPILISPPGSANTCGSFHPTQPWRVIFGSTIVKPKEQQHPGYQSNTSRYRWSFPSETDVVTRTVGAIYRDYAGVAAPMPTGPDVDQVAPLFTRPEYDAECSYSPDGRLVLYAHVREDRPEGAPADADIWVYDTQTKERHALVEATGYDGGPFFSPDAKRICYRSDRSGDNLLQLFVADLKFDARGAPTGIAAEHQLTRNDSVNWAPYWHPSGEFLLYGTSEAGHANYEIFAVETDTARPVEAIRRRRVTFAPGADVLPVFNHDGSLMMWTAQRGNMAPGESKPSSQLWVSSFQTGLTNDALFRVLTEQEARAAAAKAIADREADPVQWAQGVETTAARIEDGSGWTVVVWQLPKTPENFRRVVLANDGRVLGYVAGR